MSVSIHIHVGTPSTDVKAIGQGDSNYSGEDSHVSYERYTGAFGHYLAKVEQHKRRARRSH